MNYRFWKKQEKEITQQERAVSKYYYPKMVIKYNKYLDDELIDNHAECKALSINFCCEKMELESWYSLKSHRGGKFLEKNRNLFKGDLIRFNDYKDFKPSLYGATYYKTQNINYCPYCGAKIERECIKTYEKVITGCDEILEPEKVIPAKTKKVCKYDWKEVK